MFDIFGWTKAPDLDLTTHHWAQFQWVRSSIEWFVYPWVEWRDGGGSFYASSGLGAFFASMVPVACLSGLVGVMKRETEEWSVITLFLSGGALILIVWWVLDDREPRYAMGALPFLVPLVAWTVSQTQGRARKVYEVIAALCIVSMLFIIFSCQLVEFSARFLYARQFARHAFYLYPEMLDRLPPGSTVVNFAGRTLNYALYGKKHQNRIISYVDTCRTLEAQFCREEAPGGGSLAYATLRRLGATHIVTEGYPTLSLDECVRLQEIDQMEKQPIIGTFLPKPLTLYEIKYCDTEVRMRNQ